MVTSLILMLEVLFMANQISALNFISSKHWQETQKYTTTEN